MNVRFGDITSTTLQLFWHSGFNGYSSITSFKLEIRRNSSRTWSTVLEKIKSENYTVHGLVPYMVYHLRVFARNKIGWSGPSRSVSSRTAEDGRCHAWFSKPFKLSILDYYLDRNYYYYYLKVFNNDSPSGYVDSSF